MTSQALFAAEFPADILPTQLRELLKEAAPALLDGLFEDLRAIESVTMGGRESGDTFAGAIESTSVISQLPPAYRAWYSPLFVRALIVCATRIGQALSGGDGAEPTCTAEELIWHLLLQEAIATYESQELSPDGRSDLADDVARFEDFIYRTPTGDSSTTIPKPSVRQRRTCCPPSRTSSSRSNPGSNHSTGSPLTRIPTAET